MQVDKKEKSPTAPLTLPPLDFQRIFEAFPDAIVVLGPDLRVLTATETYLQMARVSLEDLRGQHLGDIVPANPAANGQQSLLASLQRVQATLRPHQMEVQRCPIGRPDTEGGNLEKGFWRLCHTPVLDSEGRLLCILHQVNHVAGSRPLQGQDQSQCVEAGMLAADLLRMTSLAALNEQRLQETDFRLQQAESSLSRLALLDTLTGLPNRPAFSDLLEESLVQARLKGQSLAVVFLNLDNFKNINDSLGHALGDLVLAQVALRLRAGFAGPLARLGADEFALAVPAADETALMGVIRSLHDLLATPFAASGVELFLTASLGISLFPDHGQASYLLIQQADIAMLAAKQQGKNTYCLYSPGMNETARDNLHLSNSIHKALARNEFVLHYQPRVCLITGQVTAVEALIRWNHPALGQVPPARFIPLAEQVGLIGEVGAWVLLTACRQMAYWRHQNIPIGRVAVNLSARQLLSSLPQELSRILREAGLPPQYLELEVTESMVAQDPAHASRILSELRQMGVRIAMDDFGTGYSSLAYLKKFPIDHLKIDRCFLQDIPQDDGDRAITQAIITLAGSLHLGLVAEGVENVGQLRFLQAHGCAEGQGYLLSCPVEAGAMARLAGKGFAAYLLERRPAP